MKISILSSVLILGLGAVLAWRVEQRIDLARQTHQAVAAEAARLGISNGFSRLTDRPRLIKRSHAEKEADANQLVADLIAFDREKAALYQQKLTPDSAMRARDLEIMDRIMSMDSTQMAIIIAKIRACEDLGETTRQAHIGFCISALAVSNPQAALSLFNEFREFLKGGMDQQVIFPSLSAWAQSDSVAALEWFRKNGDDYSAPLAESAKSALVLGAAANDPRFAFQLLGELGIEDKEGCINSIFDMPATAAERTECFSAFRDFLTTLPDEKSRQEAAGNVYACLTHDVVAEGFEPAVKWLEDTKLSPSEITSFAQALSGTLGYMKLDVSRGQWIEWAGANVPSDKRRQLVHEMVYYWTIDDFQATGKWLNTVADGPIKQAAIRTYAATISPYQPEAAAAFAIKHGIK